MQTTTFNWRNDWRWSARIILHHVHCQVILVRHVHCLVILVRHVHCQVILVRHVHCRVILVRHVHCRVILVRHVHCRVILVCHVHSELILLLLRRPVDQTSRRSGAALLSLGGDGEGETEVRVFGRLAHQAYLLRGGEFIVSTVNCEIKMLKTCIVGLRIQTDNKVVNVQR